MSKTQQTEQDESKFIKLEKPIKAHDEEIDALVLRKPTGKDVRELGLPYRIGSDESVNMNADIVAKYVSRLAAIPMSSVDMMTPVDMNAACWAVAGFFMDSTAKS